MSRMANGREREPFCGCQHGPAVHRDGKCVLRHQCGCTGWDPVPYVDDTPPCARCVELEAEIVRLRAAIPGVIPRQRQPLPSEARRARMPQRFHD